MSPRTTTSPSSAGVGFRRVWRVDHVERPEQSWLRQLAEGPSTIAAPNRHDRGAGHPDVMKRDGLRRSVARLLWAVDARLVPPSRGGSGNSRRSSYRGRMARGCPHRPSDLDRPSSRSGTRRAAVTLAVRLRSSGVSAKVVTFCALICVRPSGSWQATIQRYSSPSTASCC